MAKAVYRGALVVALMAVTSAQSRSQSADPQSGIGRGARVRVFAPDMRSDPYVGRIDSLDAALMVLDTAGVRYRLGFETGPVLVDQYRRVTIRLASIREIEVSGGRTVVGATVRGAVIGAFAGGALLGLGNMPERNPGWSDFVRGAPAGLALGAVVGAVVGWGLGGERWLPAIVPR